MPLYSYVCKKCHVNFDKAMTLKEYEKKRKMVCPNCKSRATKRTYLSDRHGLQCDDAVNITWFNSALKVLQPDYEKPLQTRGEYKRYLKDRGLIAAG